MRLGWVNRVYITHRGRRQHPVGVGDDVCVDVDAGHRAGRADELFGIGRSALHAVGGLSCDTGAIAEFGGDVAGAVGHQCP